MPILQIITNPNKILRTRSKAVPEKDIPGLKDFFKDMEATMIERDGIGLAANQVGITKRIISINTKDGPITIINPKFSRKSIKKEDAEEGCLSVPNVYGIVSRNIKLTVTGHDKDSNKVKIRAQGLMARVFQHEVDHIDGKLFIDRIKEITKGDNYKSYKDDYQDRSE